MQAKIILKDEVNVKIENLSTSTRKRLNEKYSYLLPHAFHVPAFKMGRWDGKVNFFTFGALTYLNLLDEIIPILIEEGYDIELDDQREKHNIALSTIVSDHFSNKSWPEGHPAAGTPIILRDYQTEIINKFVNNPQSVQEIATGAGKTLITAALSNLVEEFGRTIVIVPNKGLVTQTEDDYINLGLDVGVFFGDRKEYNKTHTICTWQSLDSMQRMFKAGTSTLSIADFVDGVVCVIVDECHGAKADVLRKVLTNQFSHIPLRFGLTGTIPKEDHVRVGITCAVGPTVGDLSAHTLQETGVLANCNVHIWQLLDTVRYSDYQSELTYLTTNPARLDYLADIISTIGQSGNTLVLVDRVKAGEGLVERLGEEDAVFVSGKMKNNDRREHYKEIENVDNKIIVATYGVAAVGINLPRIFNMVLIEPGKSFVRVIQSIGRGLRTAKDKDSVEIYDICSAAKYSKKHLTTRKKFYKDAQYPFRVTKVDYLTELKE